MKQVAWGILRPWRWLQHVAPKRRLHFSGLHGIVYQKTALFMISNGMLQIILVDSGRLEIELCGMILLLLEAITDGGSGREQLTERCGT
jgi:hypothetical protein